MVGLRPKRKAALSHPTTPLPRPAATLSRGGRGLGDVFERQTKSHAHAKPLCIAHIFYRFLGARGIGEALEVTDFGRSPLLE
jgi:hypothetical protein